MAASKVGATKMLANNMTDNITKLKNRNNFKIVSLDRARGVVVCKDCLTPRCIYFLNAISNTKPSLPPTTEGNNVDIILTTCIEIQNYRAMAQDRLHDAMESPIFVCGMAPMDQYDPLYVVFHCDSSLDCSAHIEANFYASKIQPSHIEPCYHCAGEYDSQIELNSSLEAPDGPYLVVLPILCKM
jgi:hypothetical protein